MGNIEQEKALNAGLDRLISAISNEMSEVKNALAAKQVQLEASDSPIDLSDEIARVDAATANIQSMVQSDAAAPVEEPAPVPAPGEVEPEL